MYLRGVQYLSIIALDLQVAINSKDKKAIQMIFQEFCEIVKPYL